jgi:hypothetical protein
MIPPVRVAMANPVSRPTTAVAGHDGSMRRVISTMASVAHVIAARNGTSIGVTNRLP